MRGCRKRASNDTPEEPVSHRLRKAGSGVSYGIKRRRNVKRGLTTPQGLLMSLLPVGEGTFPTIERPPHRPPAALHHGQHPKSAGPRSDEPGWRQFALPSDFHCGRAGCTMGAATATPAVNSELVSTLRKIQEK